MPYAVSDATLLLGITLLSAAYALDNYVLWPRRRRTIAEMEKLYRERYRTEPPARPSDFMNRWARDEAGIIEYEHMLREATSY